MTRYVIIGLFCIICVLVFIYGAVCVRYQTNEGTVDEFTIVDQVTRDGAVRGDDGGLIINYNRFAEAGDTEQKNTAGPDKKSDDFCPT